MIVSTHGILKPLATFSNLYSFSMDGTDENAVVGDHNDFSFGAFTGIIWMKRAAASGNRCLFSKYQSTMTEYYAALIGTTLRFLCYSSPGNLKGRTAPMSTAGSWVGLAFVDDGGVNNNTNKIYTITGGTVTQIDNADLGGGLYTGKSNTAAPLRIGAIDSPMVWHFNGLQYHPQFYNVALNTTELAEVGANPHKDARTFSFGSNLVSAYSFPNGQSDFPTWTDYKNGHNGAMQNSESTDISTDIP